MKIFNIIKNYIEKQKNKSHLLKWEISIKEKICNEILDPYIDWKSRIISFFDGDYIIFKDKENPYLDLLANLNTHSRYRISEKIPLVEVISDELLKEIKQYKRFKKIYRIM